MTPRCGRVVDRDYWHRCFAPAAHLPGDDADAVDSDPAAERREIAAELLAHGIKVYVVPDAPIPMMTTCATQRRIGSHITR